MFFSTRNAYILHFRHSIPLFKIRANESGGIWEALCYKEERSTFLNMDLCIYICIIYTYTYDIYGAGSMTIHFLIHVTENGIEQIPYLRVSVQVHSIAILSCAAELRTLTKLANAVQWINLMANMVSWETSRRFDMKQGASYSPQ